MRGVVISAFTMATIMFLITPLAPAQTIKLAVKGGGNLASMVGESVPGDVVGYRVGVSVGGAIVFQLTDMLALQPEILFSTKGMKTEYVGSGKTEVTGLRLVDGEFHDYVIPDFSTYGIETEPVKVESVENGPAEWKLSYLQMPILLRGRLAVNERTRLNLFTGPVFGIRIGEKISVELNDRTVEHEGAGTKMPDFGLVIGGALDWGSALVEARYTLGLISITEGFCDCPESRGFYANNSVISIMIGFYLDAQRVFGRL